MYIASDEDLAAAMDRMRKAGTDLAEYEVKSAAGGFPKSIPDTISAFANTYGGTIVLGVSEKDGFSPVPDSDTKMLQSKLAQAARELVEPPQAVDLLVLQLEGRPVVVANVREAPVREKPCFVRKLGQMGGSFVRTGDGDHRMSLYEIDRFIENQHRTARNDAEPVPDATLSDLDEDLLEGWLSHARATTLDRSRAVGDEELMANRRVAAVDGHGVLRPTLAGIMALGKYPQKFFPRLDVVFTRYPGPRKGELDEAGRRFVDSANVDGPIPQMVVETVRAVSRNMKHGAIVRGALRENVPDYPLPAVREAVANALMHRDYSVDGQGTPVLVDMYPDRWRYPTQAASSGRSRWTGWARGAAPRRGTSSWPASWRTSPTPTTTAARVASWRTGAPASPRSTGSSPTHSWKGRSCAARSTGSTSPSDTGG